MLLYHIFSLPALAIIYKCQAAHSATSVPTRCNTNCVVSLDSNPVCASNLVTYQNEDEFDCAKDCYPDLQKLHEGTCNNESSIAAADIRENLVQPIKINVEKGSEDRIYGRRNTLDCGNCACPQSRSLVCGSDGVTYLHPCHLKCKQRCNSENLHQLHTGKCSDSSNEP